MTKSEFLELQHKQHESGLSLKRFLNQESISYSTYNYWRRKYCSTYEAVPASLAPISIRQPVSPNVGEGVSVSLPNGVLVHFSPGMAGAAVDFLTKAGGVYVQS